MGVSGWCGVGVRGGRERVVRGERAGVGGAGCA